MRKVAVALLILGGMAAPAAAQVDATVTDRLDQLRRQDAPLLPPEELIRTGRDDLILLRTRKFFTLYAQPSARWTDNAGLTRNNRSSDWIGSVSVGGHFETRIAERFDVFADAGLFGARYKRNPRLDFDGWQASVGAATELWGNRIALSYAPTASYTRGFGRHQVTQHALTLAASRPITLAPRLVLLPALSGQYAPSHPDDFTVYGGRGGATLFYSITNSLIAWASVEGYVRAYTGFFENLTLTRRTDHGLNAVAAMRWTPHEMVTLVSSISFTRNYSTYAPLSYRAVNLSPSVLLQFKF